MDKPPAYPSEKLIRSAMIERVEEFSRITGISAADIGKLALKNTAFVYQARRGQNFTIATYRKLMTWLDRRWPPDSVPAPASNGSRHPQRKKRPRRANARP